MRETSTHPSSQGFRGTEQPRHCLFPDCSHHAVLSHQGAKKYPSQVYLKGNCNQREKHNFGVVLRETKTKRNTSTFGILPIFRHVPLFWLFFPKLTAEMYWGPKPSSGSPSWRSGAWKVSPRAYRMTPTFLKHGWRKLPKYVGNQQMFKR